MKYNINEGRRDWAVRVGCEKGLYLFFHDYAEEVGMSMSAAVRRLALIGAHCEKEHDKLNMPKTYDKLEDLSPEDYGGRKRDLLR